METCGEKARRITFLVSLRAAVCPDAAGEEDRAVVDAPGEKIEPLTALAVGVTVPDSLGELVLPGSGSEVVEAKRVESEAFERR